MDLFLPCPFFIIEEGRGSGLASKYNPTRVQIGQRIIKRRTELDMSATELAIQADMTASSLSLIESGQRNPSVDVLCRIAKALQAPLSYFQPEILDEYLSIPPDLVPIIEGLKALPLNERRKMSKMFKAQLDSILS